eukprot:10412630-Alexandrium_andersonii.AAC.1
MVPEGPPDLQSWSRVQDSGLQHGRRGLALSRHASQLRDVAAGDGPPGGAQFRRDACMCAFHTRPGA